MYFIVLFVIVESHTLQLLKLKNDNRNDVHQSINIIQRRLHNKAAQIY